MGGRGMRAFVHEPWTRNCAMARDAGAAATGKALVPIRAGLGLPATGADRTDGGGAGMSDGVVVVVGATAGLGKEVARHYADADRDVVITGRDEARVKEVADELGGKTTGVALDLSRPNEIADALRGVGEVHRLVLAGVQRDQNTMRDYDVDAAIRLVNPKLVGDTEVAHVAASAGANVADSPTEAIRDADVVVSSLADDAAVESVFGQTTDALHESQVVLEMSTISPVTTRRVGERVLARGAGYLDAPVSGSVSLVEAGDLTIQVGGGGGTPR